MVREDAAQRRSRELTHGSAAAHSSFLLLSVRSGTLTKAMLLRKLARRSTNRWSPEETVRESRSAAQLSFASKGQLHLTRCRCCVLLPVEDLSRSIHMAEAGDQGEGMLFGLTEEQPEVRRTRRDVSGRFEVVTDMETPDIEVSDSQFAVPKEEQAAREKGLRPTIERRAVNRHTEIFRKSQHNKHRAMNERSHPIAFHSPPPCVRYAVVPVSSRRSSASLQRLVSLRSLRWTIFFARS